MIQPSVYIIVALLMVLATPASSKLRSSSKLSRRDLHVSDAQLSSELEGLRETLHGTKEEAQSSAEEAKEEKESEKESELDELILLESQLRDALKNREADVAATDAEAETAETESTPTETKTTKETKTKDAETTTENAETEAETAKETVSTEEEEGVVATSGEEESGRVSYLHDQVACGNLGNYLRKSVLDCEQTCQEKEGCVSFSFSFWNMGRCLLCSTPVPSYEAVLPGVTFGTFSPMSLQLAEAEEEEACGEVGGCAHYWQPCGFTFVPFQKVQGTNYYQDTEATFAQLAKKCIADGDSCTGFSTERWLFSSEEELTTEVGECMGVFLKDKDEYDEEEESQH